MLGMLMVYWKVYSCMNLMQDKLLFFFFEGLLHIVQTKLKKLESSGKSLLAILGAQPVYKKNHLRSYNEALKSTNKVKKHFDTQKFLVRSSVP